MTQIQLSLRSDRHGLLRRRIPRHVIRPKDVVTVALPVVLDPFMSRFGVGRSPLLSPQGERAHVKPKALVGPVVRSLSDDVNVGRMIDQRRSRESNAFFDSAVYRHQLNVRHSYSVWKTELLKAFRHASTPPATRGLSWFRSVPPSDELVSCKLSSLGEPSLYLLHRHKDGRGSPCRITNFTDGVHHGVAERNFPLGA